MHQELERLVCATSNLLFLAVPLLQRVGHVRDGGQQVLARTIHPTVFSGERARLTWIVVFAFDVVQ